MIPLLPRRPYGSDGFILDGVAEAAPPVNAAAGPRGAGRVRGDRHRTALVTFQPATGYGTFEIVTYNGSDVTSDPNVVVNYGSNSITLDLIPEPATIGLFGAASLAWLLRRRR